MTPSNAKDDAVEAVTAFERLIIKKVAQAIDDDLARQAKVQSGVWYEPADECGVAGAQMSIVPDELARAAIEAMRAAQTVEAEDEADQMLEAIADLQRQAGHHGIADQIDEARVVLMRAAHLTAQGEGDAAS